MPDPANEKWHITVEALGRGPPTVVRVRRCLKFLLRSFGLKCTSVHQETAFKGTKSDPTARPE